MPYAPGLTASKLEHLEELREEMHKVWVHYFERAWPDPNFDEPGRFKVHRPARSPLSYKLLECLYYRACASIAQLRRKGVEDWDHVLDVAHNKRYFPIPNYCAELGSRSRGLQWVSLRCLWAQWSRRKRSRLNIAYRVTRHCKSLETYCDNARGLQLGPDGLTVLYLVKEETIPATGDHWRPLDIEPDDLAAYLARARALDNAVAQVDHEAARARLRERILQNVKPVFMALDELPADDRPRGLQLDLFPAGGHYRHRRIVWAALVSVLRDQCGRYGFKLQTSERRINCAEPWTRGEYQTRETAARALARQQRKDTEHRQLSVRRDGGARWEPPRDGEEPGRARRVKPGPRRPARPITGETSDPSVVCQSIPLSCLGVGTCTPAEYLRLKYDTRYSRMVLDYLYWLYDVAAAGEPKDGRPLFIGSEDQFPYPDDWTQRPRSNITLAPVDAWDWVNPWACRERKYELLETVVDKGHDVHLAHPPLPIPYGSPLHYEVVGSKYRHLILGHKPMIFPQRRVVTWEEVQARPPYRPKPPGPNPWVEMRRKVGEWGERAFGPRTGPPRSRADIRAENRTILAERAGTTARPERSRRRYAPARKCAPDPGLRAARRRRRLRRE